MRVLLEREDGSRVLKMEHLTDAEPWRASFAGSFQEVWSDPPYGERWFPEEAEGVLRRNLSVSDSHTLLAVRDSGVVSGFALGCPVSAAPGVVREVRGLLPIEHTFYFSELGVLEQYRKRGFGRQMVALRLSLLNRQKYHHVLMRISTQRDFVYEFYRAQGFEDMGLFTEVTFRRMDGGVRTDRRVYLSLAL